MIVIVVDFLVAVVVIIIIIIIFIIINITIIIIIIIIIILFPLFFIFYFLFLRSRPKASDFFIIFISLPDWMSQNKNHLANATDATGWGCFRNSAFSCRQG